jgi:predicted RNA methylase
MAVISDLRSVRGLVSLVHDSARAHAYGGTIERALASQGRRVLVLGAGIGVFAMVARRMGAEVTVVEPRSRIAALAREVWRRNGLADQEIEHVSDVSRWQPEKKHDLLVVDALDDTLLGAGIAGLLDAIRPHLVRDAVVIPSQARVYVTLLEHRVGSRADFDLDEIDALRPGPIAEHLLLPEESYRPLSGAHLLAEIPFTEPLGSWRHTLEIPVTAAGMLTAVLFSLELCFAGGVTVRADPSALRPEAHLPFMWYVSPRDIEAGQTLTQEFLCDRIHILPADAKRTRGEPSLEPWQLAMVCDRARNDAFDSAIVRAVQGGASRVLDIGTGTGLLAMMAARAGATSVTGCEQVSHVAKRAMRIVEKNGFSDRVTVHCARSYDLEKPAEPYDLVLAELVDYGLLGEGIVRVLAHAKRSLGCEKARILPQRARVYAVCIEVLSPPVLGYDMQPLDTVRWQPEYEGVRLEALEHRKITDTFKVSEIDFEDPVSSGASGVEFRTIEITATRDGTITAIAYWYTLFVDGEATLTTGPGTPTHWRQALRYLPVPYACRSGDTIPIVLDCGHDDMRFEIHKHQSRHLRAVPWPTTQHWIASEQESIKRAEALEREIQRLLDEKKLSPEELLRILDDLAFDGPSLGLDPRSVAHIRRLISNSIHHPWGPQFRKPKTFKGPFKTA